MKFVGAGEWFKAGFPQVWIELNECSDSKRFEEVSRKPYDDIVQQSS